MHKVVSILKFYYAAGWLISYYYYYYDYGSFSDALVTESLAPIALCWFCSSKLEPVDCKRAEFNASIGSVEFR